MTMKETIKQFCEQFGYPKEAAETLAEAGDRLEKAPEKTIFTELVRQYQTDRLTDFQVIWEPLAAVAEKTGIHLYTVHLLFFIFCAEHLKELYRQKGIPEEFWYDSVTDLKWKTEECYKMYGIWGIFVAFWYPGFFQMKIFALGRLEFEIYDMPADYHGTSFPLKKGDPVLSVHIPSSGSLKQEDCVDSFRKAYHFFRKYFPQIYGDKEILPFFCSSWLLYKKHEEFLPEHSNIRKFMKFFDIFSSWEDSSYHDFWRIFYKPHNAKREELPCETSLQKAYLQWFDRRNLPGQGLGVFFFDGQQIIQ